MTENSYDSDILEETPTIAVDKIKLTTKWVFWHQLQNQSKASDKNDTYFENLKELVEFEDLFTFWQFWLFALLSYIFVCLPIASEPVKVMFFLRVGLSISLLFCAEDQTVFLYL